MIWWCRRCVAAILDCSLNQYGRVVGVGLENGTTLLVPRIGISFYQRIWSSSIFTTSRRWELRCSDCSEPSAHCRWDDQSAPWTSTVHMHNTCTNSIFLVYKPLNPYTSIQRVISGMQQQNYHMLQNDEVCCSIKLTQQILGSSTT